MASLPWIRVTELQFDLKVIKLIKSPSLTFDLPECCKPVELYHSSSTHHSFIFQFKMQVTSLLSFISLAVIATAVPTTCRSLSNAVVKDIKPEEAIYMISL